MATFKRSAASPVLGILLGFVVACTNGGSTPTPVEQLPNPDFARKPQIYLIADELDLFWNLPHPGELELKHRVRLTLAKNTKLADLEASLRDLNSREGDLLLFSGTRLLPAAKTLALFSHPSGRRTFHLDASKSGDASIPQIHIDLAPTIELIKVVCARWTKDLKHSCLWEKGLPGAPSTAPASGPTIAVGFSEAPASGLKLSLRLDWVQWMEQMLRDLAAGPTNTMDSAAPWRQFRLSSGTIVLQLTGEHPDFDALKAVLQEERMKRL